MSDRRFTGKLRLWTEGEDVTVVMCLRELSNDDFPEPISDWYVVTTEAPLDWACKAFEQAGSDLAREFQL